MKRRHHHEGFVNIAKERIEILFRQAREQARAGRLDRADRYVFLARKIAMKFNVKLSKEQRRMFCHKCRHYFLPGKNLSVRTNPRTRAVEYKCLDCGRTSRFPYAKERAGRRKF